MPFPDLLKVLEDQLKCDLEVHAQVRARFGFDIEPRRQARSRQSRTFEPVRACRSWWVHSSVLEIIHKPRDLLQRELGAT